MTSDGISSEDWEHVHTLAVLVANASDDDDRPRQELLAYLRELTVKYGERPSLLATHADYVDEPRDSEQLLLRAFDLALLRDDKSNLREIALSLADLYASQLRDLLSASRWLEVAVHLAAPATAADLAECEQIRDTIARLRREP